MQNDSMPPTIPTYSAPNPNLDYSFITNPSPIKSKRFNLNGSSMKTKILVIIGSLVILWILFAIIGSLLANPIYNTTDFTNVLQNQAELIHIFSVDTSTPQELSSLTPTNQGLVNSALLVFTSDQNRTLAYLKSNGTIINPIVLTQGINSSYDTQLNNSLQTNEFNQVFDQIVKAQLNQYAKTLDQTYASTKGPKGKAMLKSEYSNVNLINKQINLASG